MTTARTLADEGTEAVLAADTSVTRDYASLIREAIEDAAEDAAEGFRWSFTAEDMRDRIARVHPGREPHHPNLIGAVFREMANAGRIRPIGWTEATRPESRGRVLRIWRAV